MKFSIYTLGCKVNQYESEVVAEAFEKKGHSRVSHKEKSDVCFINTCAVTEESIRKSMQIIRRAKRLNPNAVIVCAGCASQAKDYRSQIEEICDITIGNKNKPNIPEIVERYFINKTKISVFTEIENERHFEEMSAYTGERTRATLKIQDGCNNFCSYCIIPFLRGRIRSKPFDETIKEMHILSSEKGYKEIVLTGIHLDNYGKDLGNKTLTDVLEASEDIDGLERIRLSSLEPVFITKENVERMKKVTKLCHNFHLSLQSGCDATLKRMNRHYTASDYENCVRLLRSAFCDATITTDIIVGFPGETEREFNETLMFIKKIKFTKIHIFPFSERKGTKAETMDGQVSQEVKNRRVKLLSEAASEIRKEILRNMIGQKVSVLFETEKNGKIKGYTSNYIEVEAIGNKNICGQTKNVTVTESNENFLTGKLN